MRRSRNSSRCGPIGQAFVSEFHELAEGRTIHSYASILMDWRGNRYVELEDEAVKKQLQVWSDRTGVRERISRAGGRAHDPQLRQHLDGLARQPVRRTRR